MKTNESEISIEIGSPIIRARRVRDPEETIHRLTDAALDVMAKVGYAETTVDEIVQKAGLSKGAFYHHFSSKDDLYIYILEKRFERNRKMLAEMCCFEGRAREWIHRVFETIMAFPKTDRRWQVISFEFMSLGTRNPRIRELFAQIHQDWRKEIAAPLKESEEYREGKMLVDPDTLAAMLIALVDGMLMHSTLEPENDLYEQIPQRLEPLFQSWFKE